MADPQTKLVTFLCTDVEGSTAHWERDPDAMRAALLRHDAILHELIALHSGNVFKTTGDGFDAVFSRADAALDAAVAIRDAIERTSWSALGELRLRIALHTGEAEARNGDYFGQTVNRVARLLDMAEGGQILVSEAAVGQAQRQLPAGSWLRDLGTVQLRNVAEPMRVYRLEGRRAPGPRGAPVLSGYERAATPSATVSARVGDARIGDARRGAGGLAVVAPGQVPSAPEDSTLRIYTLGGFRIERGGRQVHPNGRKALPGGRLFKCLITRETRRLVKDQAFELFFEKSGDAAEITIRTTLARFRSVVEPAVPAAQSLIVNRDGVVAIRPGADVWVDADAFEQLVARARRADAPDDLLEEADRLYGGDYLPDDLYEDWAIPRRDALRRLWADLQLDLARSRERRGDVDAAAAVLQRLLIANPCDERAARELMLLLARHGRRADAIRVFQRLVDALQKDLALAPTAETLDVRHQIVVGKPGVAGEPTGDPGGRVASRDDSRRRLDVEPRPLPPVPVAVVPETGRDEPGQRSRPGDSGGLANHAGEAAFEPQYPFPQPELLVGRQRELLDMHRALQRGRTEARTLLIGAPAGTGKSTLAGLLVDHARSMGFLCLAGGSFDQDSPAPYAPIRDALCDYLLEQTPDRLRAELGDLAADLALIVPPLGDHLGGIGGRPSGAPEPRLAEAVYRYLRLLAARQPVVLCLEDLHAADEATVEALHYLARQTRRLRVTLVGTYRTEEVATDRRLASMLTALRRERLVDETILRAFDRSETLVLISSRLDGAVSEELTDALFAVTEGNPLFVEQLILALREEGRIERRDGIWHQVATGDAPVPPVIRSVIERRFDRLPPNGREVLEMAAVMGQTFDLQPLNAAVGATDVMPVIAILDRAIAAHLVRETANGYRFGHAMIREALYRSLSRPRRAIFHARAGEAIEQIVGSRANERAAELALHFSLAAEAAPVAEKALRFSLVAGRRAATFTSHREALEHFVRACELVDRCGGADDAVRVEALTGRVNAERELSMWTACIATCRSLIAQTDDPAHRAWARTSISRALTWLGNTVQARHEVEEGLAELRGADDSVDAARVRVRLMYDRSYMLFLEGRFRDVYALGREMLDVAAPLGEGERRLLPHFSMSLGAMGLHDVGRAFEHLDETLRAAEVADIRLSQAVVHENAGIIHHRAGQIDEAAARLRRALELYRATASDLRAVNANQALGRVLLAQGDVKGALHQAELALSHAVAGRDRWAAECYDLLGTIQVLRAEWASATTSFERALAIHESVGDLADTADSLTGLGTVAELCGDWPGAERFYRRAVAVADRMDPSPEQIWPRRQLARVLIRRGDVGGGTECLEQALALVELMQPTIEYGQAMLVLAERQLQSHRHDEALTSLDRVPGQGAAMDVLVEAHAAATGAQVIAGDCDSARRHAAEAMQLATRIGTPRQLGQAYLAAARLAAAAGDHQAALEAFEIAVRAFEDAQAPYELAVAMRDYGRMLLASQSIRSRGQSLIERARSSFEHLGAQPDARACT